MLEFGIYLFDLLQIFVSYILKELLKVCVVFCYR